MELIDQKTLQKVAELSRLALDDETLATFTRQLGEILQYASRLPQLPEHLVETGDLRLENDQALQPTNPRQLLRNAVALEGGMVKVPAILDRTE